MNQDYLEAKAIILKSLKTGKLLVEFKRWEQLDYSTREKALEDFQQYRKCECGCRQYFKLSRTVYNHKAGFRFYTHAGYDLDSFLNMEY